MNGKTILAIISFLTPPFSMALAVGWGLAAGQTAVAHPQLMTSVRHRTAIAVSRKNVDVTIELTLGEIPAFAERLLIDENQDRAITAREVASYFDDQSDALQQAVTLSIAGQPVELLMLYEPEMDWGREDPVSTSHLVVRLFFFARLPSGLKAGDTLVLEDRLWSHAPSLGSYHAVGQDGIDLIAEKTASTLESTASDSQPLVMRVRCLAAPDDSSTRRQSNRGRPADPVAKLVAFPLAGSNGESDEPVDLVEMRRERPPQALTAGKLPVGWLWGLGAVAVMACTAAVLTRRPYRPRKEA